MKIVIVGLGVIGGSFAMALKEAGYREVYGIDKRRERWGLLGRDKRWVIDCLEMRI